MSAAAANPRRDVLLFFLLACTITWMLDFSLASSWARHLEPPPWALPLVGLGAWGPTLAALILASWLGTRRDVFGRWRTSPIWVVVALFAPLVLHQIANVLEVALGGQPAHWFYPPNRPEYVAALVMFSFGEEFGWRGFAYPRMATWMGPVFGSLVLGTVWGIWHLGMMFTPEKGAPELLTVAIFCADLALNSVVMAWFFERADRSMAVAIAMHAGGHLDNTTHAPESEIRLRILRFIVLAIAAGVAALALRRTSERATHPVADPL